MVLAGIAGLLVGFLAGWLWVDTEEVEDTSQIKEDVSAIKIDDLDLDETKDAGTLKTTDSSEKTNASAPILIVEAGENTVSVETQTAGTMVTIASLMLKEKSWIVIHEDDNGKPLRILGAKRFETGTHTNVAIKVLRTTEAGKTYYAMIHSDSGDAVFETVKDLPVTTSDGAPVMTKFEAK
ncbi:MAG: hypothetical protein G01um101448_141 [Parcubacteria group bacterium Gr01-1014_48]|nr:MAG: hypothetical protein Greene041614_96 [Parcubacteria group bacterium Greene0416_14]TSC74414.1 MAG: hypothetical protein G01um101448_141 [Parcubacteria group bacterium Gr01-1014_48]TSD01267.1 MAG: hypothetical protein Greene101415_356 [Parcubacteria group bacterium Greene1014_15]TSD08412.1 MAG: hypothetical protein Greene07144_128 [Parcubacteria group bacterium Greene0714_4]